MARRREKLYPEEDRQMLYQRGVYASPSAEAVDAATPVYDGGRWKFGEEAGAVAAARRRETEILAKLGEGVR